MTATTLEPSADFVGKVMQEATTYEKRRRASITIWFGVLALMPYALRELWFLLRGDFISVTSLPFSNVVATAYDIFMSTTAIYVLLAAGFLLALFVVGLPQWRLNTTPHIVKK